MEYKVNNVLRNSYFCLNNIYFPCRYIYGLLLLFFMLFPAEVTTVSAQSNSGTAETQTLSVKEALEQVKVRMGYSIWFNVQDVDLTKRVVVKFQNRTVTELLNVILKGQPLTYEINGKMIQIRRQATGAQKDDKYHLVTGKVTDANDGQPLIGCNVRVKDKNIATITDIDGNYSIKIGENDVLIFSYIGYGTKQKMPGSSSKMNISLSNNSISLDDVVVTGYQVMKKYNVS